MTATSVHQTKRADRKLVIVHTESSCGWGGQEIRVLTEAQGMIRRGHDLWLLCPGEAPIHDAAHAYGIRVVALPMARKNWVGLRALRRWLRAHPGSDVLNTHSSTDSWLAALACATLAAAPPIVRTRHVSTAVGGSLPTRWLYQSATRHIVTAGEAVRAQLVRDNGFDPRRITSVPTGIDLERFAPQDRSAARVRLGLVPGRRGLGVVATLRNWKGHRYLLDAFRGLAGAFPDWDLVLVGDGPQRRRLEQRIGELALGARVIMPGNRDDVPVWLNALDLFVLPSYGEEGVSQSVMQAMACGLAVVATAVGAIAEAVADGETGLLVPARDSARLEEALARLMADEALRARLGRAGRERACERFGIDRMLDAMEGVFRRVREGERACAA